MAEKYKKIDLEQLAKDKLAGRNGQKPVDYNLSNGAKHKTEAKAAKSSNTAEKAKPSPEKKGNVKNQPDIDRVNEINKGIRRDNEQIERRRQEISGAVDGALDLVARKLSSKNLSEKDRVRLTWVKNSTKGAMDKLKSGKYLVEIKEGEKVVESRAEGLPTEALVDAVAYEIQDLRRNVGEIERIQQLKDRADKSSLDETSKKREWHKFLEELPEGNLKKRIVARVEGWKQADEAQGVKYDRDKMEQQLGEACFEVLKEYSQDQIDRLKKLGGEKSREIGKLEKILNTLDGASEKYFFHHYKKLSSELSQSERQLQDKYTKREANYIAKDPVYRDMLLEDFSDELPKGFDKMNKLQQDYELAMLALDNRLILNMPRKKKELEVPGVQYEEAITPPVKEEDPHKVTTPEPPKPVPVKPNPIEPLPIPVHPEPVRPEPVPVKPEPVPEPYPKTPEKQDKKLFLIDISEIAKRMAWTKSEEKLRQQFDHKGGFFGRVVKNAWKGLSENHYRLKYYQEALQEIKNDNNLMRAISERISGQAIPGGTRLSGEYIELLDKTVAEYKHDVVDTQREVGDSMNNNPEVQQHFAELLYRYRTNKWDGAQYNGLDKRACVELFVKERIAKDINDNTKATWTKDVDRMKEAKGLLYASNFYEILESVDKNYKDQIDAAVKGVMEKNPDANIEFIREAISKQVEGVQGLNLQLGLKDRDIVNNRPKGILNLYERAVNWSENHKVLGKIVLNPFVMGAVATLGTQGVQRAIKWAAVGGAVAAGASGFWIPLGVGALAGATWRMVKRGKDVKYDIAQEQRHETLGGKGSEILDKNQGLRYNGAAMLYKDAMAQVAALKGKNNFSDAEKLQLAKIYARLQRERDTLADTQNKFANLDMFNMDEDTGKRYASPAAAKADLRIALKNLGITEQDLQGRIDVEKAAITTIVKETNKRQGEFMRSEMLKSGVSGAIMGFAGGILAQEAIHLGGEQVEKLWGGHYFKSHGTNFDRIKDWVKGSKIYQSNFGYGAAVGTAINHGGGLWHVSNRNAHEWVGKVSGQLSGGGQVEHIHTQDFNDNNLPHESVAEHVHNANELKMFISKDSADNIRFKVPVEQFKSWVFHGEQVKMAGIDKAFAEGHIKMIFVPDGSGHGAHEAITFKIDPVTKELIIPKDSNIRNLFDEVTGMFKGKGYFGLAEQVGVRPDGSTNYTWINSLRGNGGNINFGQNVWQDDIRIVGPGPVEAAHDYNSPTVATVPPQRKVFMRPEERAKANEKKKKKEEEKAKKKAEQDAKKKAAEKASSKSSHSETGGGGGGGSDKAVEKKKEEEKVKEPEFKGDVLKRYTNSKLAVELLKVYESHSGGLGKIDKKSIKFAIEGNKHKGILSGDRPVQKDLAKAVWELEQALVIGKVISQDQADEVYGEISEPPPAEKQPAKPAAEGGRPPKPAVEGRRQPAAEAQEPAESTTDDDGDPSQVPDREQASEVKDRDWAVGRRELEAKWGKKFNLVEVPNTPERKKLAAKVLLNLGRALDRADEQSVKTALDKTFKGRSKQGLYVEFVKEGNNSKFENGVLILPVDAGPVDILKALEMVGVKRKKETEKTKTPSIPTGGATKQESPKIDEKEELEKKTSEVIQHFKAEADKAGLTPKVRAMFDKLLADAIPGAIKELPDRAKTLSTIPIEFHKIDPKSDKVTGVTYIISTKTFSFAIGGKDYEYDVILENFKGDLQVIG